MLSVLLALALGVASTPRGVEPPLNARSTAQAGEDLFADVRVNGAETNLIVQFTHTGDDLSASGDDLRELGIDVAGGTAPVRLRSIHSLSYRVNEATQTVHIQIAAAAMRKVAIGPAMIQAEEATPAWGGLVNYSLYGDSRGSGGATGELRLFGPVGRFSTAFLLRRTDGDAALTARRLDTSFVREDAARMRRLTIGDFIAPDGSVDGAIRGAGIQLATDFTLQPDLITAPMPRLSGGDGVPATVDLYVDGVRRLTQDVDAGRFAIFGVPMVDGAGQISLLVKDALGHESVQQLSFYSSRDLLRPGLTASSVQVGLLRENPYQTSDHYGAAFASAAVRRGMNDRLTTELRIAMAQRVQVAGGSLTAKLGELAILSTSLDLSRSDRGTGGQVGLSIRRDDRAFSVFAVAQKSLGRFETLASFTAPITGWRLQAGGAWRLSHLGQLSVSGTMIRQNSARTSILAASWSRPVGRRLSAFANVVETRSGRSGLLVAAGFTMALSTRSSASAQAGQDPQGGSASVSWSQAAEPDGGASWRAGASTGGGSSRLVGGVTYRGQTGEVGADVQVDRSGASAQVFASGAAVWLGGRPMLADRVGQNFAVIETGQANVGVTLENRSVGQTRRDGSLLLPFLPSNTPAKVALDYDGIDLDHEAARTEVSLRARGAGGSIVRMPIRLLKAMTIRIVTADGSPMPLGSIVRKSDGRETVIGYDGVAYLTDIAGVSSVEVRTGDARCTAVLRRTDDDPLVCR